MAKVGTSLGVSSKPTFYMGHVLQRAIAILLPCLEVGFLGEKGLGGLQTLFLLPFFSPSINQPQVPFPFLWCDCTGQLLPTAEGRVTSHHVPLHTWGTFIPAAETRGQAFVHMGPASFLSPVQTFNEAELRKVAHRGQEEWAWHVQDMTLLLASASQVCHTVLEVRKSPAGV